MLAHHLKVEINQLIRVELRFRAVPVVLLLLFHIPGSCIAVHTDPDVVLLLSVEATLLDLFLKKLEALVHILEGVKPRALRVLLERWAILLSCHSLLKVRVQLQGCFISVELNGLFVIHEQVLRCKIDDQVELGEADLRVSLLATVQNGKKKTWERIDLRHKCIAGGLCKFA